MGRSHDIVRRRRRRLCRSFSATPQFFARLAFPNHLRIRLPLHMMAVGTLTCDSCAFPMPYSALKLEFELYVGAIFRLLMFQVGVTHGCGNLVSRRIADCYSSIGILAKR